MYNVGMKKDYELIRAKRKTVGITVDREGRVVVRAPRGVSLSDIEKIVEKHRPWIEKKKSERKNAPDARVELTEEQKASLRSLCRKTVTEKCRYYSDLMGVAPEKIRVGSALSRFGCCSSKGNITFSLYLMLYPEEAVELVVVHELCHLKYMDHSKDFYALLSKYLPDHKERKKLLSPAYRMSFEKAISVYSETFGN